MNNKNYSYYKALKKLNGLADSYNFKEYHFSNTFVFYFNTKSKADELLTLKLEIIFGKPNDSDFDQKRISFLFSNNKRKVKCKNENEIKTFEEKTESIIKILNEIKSNFPHNKEALDRFSKEDTKLYGVDDQTTKNEESLELQYLCFKVGKINASIDFKELESITKIISKEKNPINFIEKFKEDLLGSCGKEILERIELLYSK